MQKKRTLFLSLSVALAVIAVGVFTSLRAMRVAPGAPSTHIRGPLNAAVVVTFYADVSDRTSLEAYGELRHLAETFPLDLALEYRHFPQSHLTRWGTHPAVALECAARVGAFWRFLDRAYAALGDGVGGGGDGIASCVRERSVKATIEADRADAKARGITSSPAVLINGKRFDGAIRFETLRGIATDLFSQSARAGEYPIMGVAELWERLSDRIPPLVLDVRDENAFARVHVRGARSMPLLGVEDNRAALEQFVRENISTPFIVVVGDGGIVSDCMGFFRKQGLGVMQFEGMEESEKVLGFPLEGNVQGG